MKFCSFVTLQQQLSVAKVGSCDSFAGINTGTFEWIKAVNALSLKVPKVRLNGAMDLDGL